VAKGGRDSGKALKTASVEATVEDVAAADTPKRRRGPSRLLLVLLGLGILAALALWIVPVLQVQPARERLATEVELAPADRLALDNQIFGAENAARSTLAIILGAAGLLLTAGIIWRRYEKSRELKSHEQFTRAVEQLGSQRNDGSPRTEARLGGIYALERLASEAEHEYWPIMEVLTAYVRDNAAWNPQATRSNGVPGAPVRPAADIQAVLAVLGRRKPPPHSSGQEKRLLDLRETDLRGANLSGTRLDGVSLYGAHLEQADATRAVLGRSNLREAWLTGASLTELNLEGASLSRAHLEGARMNRANLQGADLSGADLRGADLWEANLNGCNLKDADLRGADLSACVLEEAILWRADLQDAVLTGAKLRETHLERANLIGVTGLTWEQGEDAYTDENTLLPEYLQPGSTRMLSGAVTPAARRAPVQRAAAPRAETVASLPAGGAGGTSTVDMPGVGALQPSAGYQPLAPEPAAGGATAAQVTDAWTPTGQPWADSATQHRAVGQQVAVAQAASAAVATIESVAQTRANESAAPQRTAPQAAERQRAAAQSAAAQSAGARSATFQPVALVPASEPAAPQPAAPQPEAGRPAAPRVAAPRAAAPQAAAATPATFDPAAPQPAAAGAATYEPAGSQLATIPPATGRASVVQPASIQTVKSETKPRQPREAQPATNQPTTIRTTAVRSVRPQPTGDTAARPEALAEATDAEASNGHLEDAGIADVPVAMDNVVQLNAPARRTRAARQAKAQAEPSKPKKAALPKHRKQGLVKPA
jgi:hypothetical protein